MSSVHSTRSSDPFETERSLMKDSHERDLRDVQNDYDEELTNAKKEYSERLVEIRRQAAEEVRKLKEDSYDSLGRRYRESEEEGMRERRMLTDSHQSAVKSMKRQGEEREDYYSNQLKESKDTANAKSTEMLEAQKSEFNEISANQRRETEALKKYYETELANEKYRSNRNSEKLVSENVSQSDRALAEQAKQYNEYIAKDREKTNYLLNEKNAEITALKTSDDPTEIPLEAKRKVEEYHYRRSADIAKKLNEQNQKTVEALKTRNAEIVQNSIDENARRIHEVSRELRGQQRAEKATLEKSYRDLEMQSRMTEESLRSRQADQQQRTYEKHTVEMSQQEDRHHESLKDQKEYLIDEKQREQMVQESRHRETERELTVKINETRREFEKKLLDQKAEHEVELANVKFDHDKRLHERDRESKRLLDERVRAYEFQLKHQESMNKEQKRLLTEHYEEELDKVKRNHALIAKTKS